MRYERATHVRYETMTIASDVSGAFRRLPHNGRGSVFLWAMYWACLFGATLVKGLLTVVVAVAVGVCALLCEWLTVLTVAAGGHSALWPQITFLSRHAGVVEEGTCKYESPLSSTHCRRDKNALRCGDSSIRLTFLLF